MPSINTPTNNPILSNSNQNTQLSKTQPIVFPVNPNQNQFLGQVYPIQNIHHQVLLNISDMNSSSQQNSNPPVTSFDQALLDTTENIDLIGPHTIANEPIAQLLQLPITLQLQLYKLPGNQYADHATQTNIKELIHLFGCQKFEICGSTAKLLLEEKGMPPLNKDIDLVMYIDMSQFDSEPLIRNQQILDLYCNHFKFPKDASLRIRCAVYPFIDHDFGCTFKPSVKQQISNKIDITLVDFRLYPLNQNRNGMPPVPRWDSIQSSFKILSHDGKSGHVKQLLSLSAIEHLNKRGILVFNPHIIKDKGLSRVQKALMNSQRYNALENIHCIQPELVEYYFEKANPYYQGVFENNNNKKNHIDSLSFNQVLDEHAYIRNEFDQKKLTSYDLYCLDIILAGSAYRNMKKLTNSHDQYQNHLVYRAQCAAVCQKQPLLLKHISTLLETPVDIHKLHPITHIWLESLMSNPKLIKSLPNTAHLNWIKFTTQSASLNPAHLQEKLDSAVKLIDQNWSKKSLKKPHIQTEKLDLRHELIQLEDEIPACKVLVSWLKKNPNDSACFVELCEKLSRIDSESSPESLVILEPILLSMPFTHHKDTKTALSMILFCLDQNRYMHSDICSQKLHEALIFFSTKAVSKKELTEFDILLKKHIKIQVLPLSPIGEMLKKISNLSELVEKMQKKASQLETLFGLYHILGDIELENSRSKNETASLINAAFYFEKAMQYKEFTSNAGFAAIECALQLGNTSKSMQLLLGMFSLLDDSDKERKAFINIVNKVVSSISLKTILEPKATALTKSFFSYIDMLTLINETLTPPVHGLIHLLGHFLVNNISTITPKQAKMVNSKILKLSSNLKLLPHEHHDYYFQLCSRASAYAAKNHAYTLIQSKEYQNKNPDTLAAVKNFYNETAVHFQAINTLNTADYIQLAEVSFFNGNIDTALRLMKLAFKDDSEFVSKLLGVLLLKLPKDQKNKAIQNFIRVIEEKKRNGQAISQDIFSQLLIAVQDGQEDITNYIREKSDTATKILNLLSNSKLSQNKFKSPSQSKFSNESLIEISALNWAISTTLIRFKISREKDVESLNYIHKIIELNQNLDTRGKIQYLTAQKDSSLIQELEPKAKSLYMFIHTQAELFATITETVSLKSALQPTSEMTSLLKEFLIRSSKLLVHFPGFTDEDRNYSHFISILNSIIISSQIFNATSPKPSTLPQILDNFIAEVELFNKEIQIDITKTYSKSILDQKISKLLGEFAIPYLNSIMDKILILSYLTDSSVTRDTLENIHNSLDKIQLKETRQSLLKHLQHLSSRLVARNTLSNEEIQFINSYFHAAKVRQEFITQFEEVLKTQANGTAKNERARRLLGLNSKAALKPLLKLAECAGQGLDRELKDQTFKAYNVK